MTERERFLERWSRKKTEAAREDTVAPATPPRSDGGAAPVADAKTAPKLEFDLSKLPSLDSITSSTDIRAFLAPGVPPDLSRAALRRAWAADPTIREFVGLAENAWNFTDPNAMPGFGDIPLGADIKRMVAEVFGDLEKSAEQAGDAPQQPLQAEAVQIAEDSPQPTSPIEGRSSDDGGDRVPALPTAPNPQLALPSNDFVHRDNIAASHQSNGQEENALGKNRRPHGRALPE